MQRTSFTWRFVRPYFFLEILRFFRCPSRAYPGGWWARAPPLRNEERRNTPNRPSRYALDVLKFLRNVLYFLFKGLNSVIESVWHGTPIIGWPLTATAKDNLLRVTARQAGLMIEQKRPTEKQFLSAFKRIYIKFYKEEMLVFQVFF